MLKETITVQRGPRGLGLSLLYRGRDRFPSGLQGIFVSKLVPGGSSMRAGLRSGAKFVKINIK